jgi:hypothetical protein
MASRNPVEPLGLRGVAAEPAGQVVARTRPLVRTADPLSARLV